MDVFPLEANLFQEAIKKIYHQHARSTDIILYEGRLPFSSLPLIAVPGFLKPQKLRMIGRLLRSDTVDDRVFEMGNWNANISTFDVL